ncbi:MAG: N-acetylmuramoyl-L-alanine amidase [Luteolibacter sp.]
MASSFSRQLPLLILGTACISALVWLGLKKPSATAPAPAPAPAPEPALSILAAAPDWQELDIYQKTISRQDFEKLLTTVFTTGERWKEFIRITDREAIIRTGPDERFPDFHLEFADGKTLLPTPRHWRTIAELPPALPEKPLDDLKIAIDPGHIGGAWAKMEERWFILDGGTPVCEGDMTLHVAKLLKPQLEALGATVFLVRDKPEPVTPLRPASLMSTLHQDSPGPDESPASLQKLAERLFYRTAEIRARAQIVNEQLKPDLVLCLHFNAEAWGNPNQPTLIDRTHFHLLLNGAYNDEEVSLADQRFAMLKKLLQRTHEEEVTVGIPIAESFAKISELPPYTYHSINRNVLPVQGHPYLWARNLLANRLYDCPVIFMEPYVMNSVQDYNRIQAGDYQGLRLVNGKEVPSIFHEYATGLAISLADHYRTARSGTNIER